MQNQVPMGPGVAFTPMTKVELCISATNLRDKDVMSKSDPLCILYVKDHGQQSYFEVGRTELITNNLNPQWVKKFELDYRFEERQYLKFHVYDWDTKSSNPKDQDSLGYLECTLGEVMACRGSQFKKPLSSGGDLIICGEEMSGSKEIMTLNVSPKNLNKKDFLGKSDPFLIFSRSLANGSFSVVHKTEIIKNNLNPNWKPIVIPLRSLCGSDADRSIKIECFDWDADGTHDLITEFQTTVKKLKEGSGPQNTYTFINPKKKANKSGYKGSGQFILHNCTIHIEPTFLDYIKGGLQMHFTVAVDFIASNGDPRNPSSLHYKQPGVDNQYSIAIKSVGEVIQDYDTDKMFPALGFGARLPPTWDVSHEFFLNGSTDNPYCEGLQGILDAYNYSLQRVGLYGPTNFSPVIRHVSQFAKSFQDGSNYFVLLIIDGIITDLQETKKTLVEASSLPMSVIIVGVGNEDFSAMELLDADNKRLCHEGRYAERDIVQFVELRQYFSSNHEHSKSSLSEAVLKEIPGQLLAYMRMAKLNIMK